MALQDTCRLAGTFPSCPRQLAPSPQAWLPSQDRERKKGGRFSLPRGLLSLQFRGGGRGKGGGNKHMVTAKNQGSSADLKTEIVTLERCVYGGLETANTPLKKKET
ncbi:hypothetical protein JZ751_008019 [Albula glossodonta]|uniref:Uncharacterized protein n=1 Tax=Albula glossodonta TaxID=121402 RepID=A0A8T2P386_9TELE|nr:hypothetical protein JZ751_008019 [Albula glossodonta]